MARPMQRALSSFLTMIAMLVIWSLAIVPVLAASSTWNADSGNWNDSANWSNGVPQDRNDIAIFPEAPAPRVITLPSGQVEIGEIRFDSSIPYTLTGSGSIFFPPAGAGTIRVLKGYHSIEATIDLQKTVSFDIAANSGLSLISPNNLLRGSGGITKTGEGELTLLAPNEHHRYLVIGSSLWKATSPLAE